MDRELTSSYERYKESRSTKRVTVGIGHGRVATLEGKIGDDKVLIKRKGDVIKYADDDDNDNTLVCYWEFFYTCFLVLLRCFTGRRMFPVFCSL